MSPPAGSYSQTLDVELPDGDTLRYDSHTFLRMKGREGARP
jgi:hypothetical protein